MTAEEFDKKIAEFDPPWKRENYTIWCPLYMNRKDGYTGKTLPQEEHYNMVWEDMQKYKGIYTQEQLFKRFSKS